MHKEKLFPKYPKLEWTEPIFRFIYKYAPSLLSEKLSFCIKFCKVYLRWGTLFFVFKRVKKITFRITLTNIFTLQITQTVKVKTIAEFFFLLRSKLIHSNVMLYFHFLFALFIYWCCCCWHTYHGVLAKQESLFLYLFFSSRWLKNGV